MEPIRDKSLDSLDADFRRGLEGWLVQATAQFPQFEFRVGETRRTMDRQRWLFGQNTSSRWVTNCDGVRFKSMHQYGIAADLVIIRKATGQAEWDSRVWRTVYAQVPPEDHNLELIPQELVHVQMKGSQSRYQGGRLADAYVKQHRLKLT